MDIEKEFKEKFCYEMMNFDHTNRHHYIIPDVIEKPELIIDWIKQQVSVEPEVKPACERKLIINIENDTVLFENLNDFAPLEFMGILHNAISTADVLYKTKVMQMVEKASKSV